jgi:hypothetical protein
MASSSSGIERGEEGTLTLAIRGMNNSIAIFQRLGQTTDESERSFGGCVDGDKLEGPFGR